MKLRQKIRAILAFAILAIISVACAACSNAATSNKEFKFVKDVPTEVLYGSELYFRDYLPREFGQDYKLYASYFNVEEQKEVEEEISQTLAFKFDYVSDYRFKIVRNDKDVLNCEIKSMPQVPRVIDGTVLQQTARPTNTHTFDRLLIIIFGGIPLENNDNATADPDYTIKATKAQFKSVEIEGVDVENIDISNNEITFDKIGYYDITYTATNRAGSDSGVVTVRTVNTKNHIDTLTGYLLENGEGLDDNQLVFDMDLMSAPEDGESIRVRYGAGKGENSAIYDAVYDAYTGKYTIDNFAHEMTKEEANRIYLESVDGQLYSTNVTLPTIITQSTITKAGTSAPLCNATEGYYLLGSDLDLANYPCAPNTTFMGVLDGNGYTISGITGEKYIDSYGAERTRGAALFSVLEDAIVKNLVLDNVHASFGMLTNRVEGACEFKNIVAKMKSYTGTRTSLIGYHAESSDTSIVRNVIIQTPIWTIPEKGTYLGMLSTHAGGKATIENLYLVGGHGLIHSTAGNSDSFVPRHYTDRKDSESGMAEEGIDYFVGKSAEVVFDGYNDGNITNYVFDMAKKMGMVVGLNNTNVDKLQTAKDGYFYLEEDIDMAGKTWAPTQNSKETVFVGTINGNGNKIINFTSPAGYLGLVGWTGDGATIKNVYIHMLTNTSKGGLTGQVKGKTTVENVVVECDKLVAGYGGVISNVVQGELTVKDSYILIKSVSGTPNGDGFIAGGEADSKNVIISNVKVADATGKYTDPYTGVSNKVGVTLGVDGKPAVNGEDYEVRVVNVENVQDVNLEEIEDATYKGLMQQAVEVILESVVMLNQDNFATVLQSQGDKYYKLEEDIDLSGINWTAGATLTGTLNGHGHTVSNFTGNNLFYGFVGTVKNINFINITTTKGIGFLSATNLKSDVFVENCIFEFTSATGDGNGRTCLLGYQVGGVATIKDTYIQYPENTSGYKGYVTTHAVSKIVFDNVYMIGGNGFFHAPSGENTAYALSKATITGTEGVNYFIYKEILDIDASKFTGLRKTLIEEAQAETLSKATVLTNKNIDVLQTATSGYFVLGEDINMAGKTWAPTQGKTNKFVGTINGRGHKIYNFTAPNGNLGLVGWTGNNATFRNLYIHAVTNTSNGMLIGQVQGANYVENCVFDVDTLSGNHSAVISSVIQGQIKVNNVLINMDVAAATYGVGFVGGRASASNNVIISNAFLVSGDGKISNVFAGDNENKTELKETTLGTDGKLAVAGEDYIVATKLSDIQRDKLTTDFLKSGYDALIG